ncbi:DUF86 domain-containing protein [Thermodesulfobacteriota bacterium]
MADRDLIVAKAGSVRRHLNRVLEKRDTDVQVFLEDIDRQESILFNLQMAIQNCIDIAAHIVSEEGLGMPGSTNEMFYLLEENTYVGAALAEKMVKACGFRNLIVHEYGNIELKQVYDIAHNNVDDLNEYLRAVFIKLGIDG